MATGQYMNPACPRGEYSSFDWQYGDSYHLSALQFDPASWAAAAAHTGRYDAEDAEDVGYNAAWWSSVTNPAEQWSCWPW